MADSGLRPETAPSGRKKGAGFARAAGKSAARAPEGDAYEPFASAKRLITYFIDLLLFAGNGRWSRPEVREAFHRLTGQGWTDALRALHPNERIYTFWKYFRNAFARDAGLRIDHLLLSPPMASRLVAAGVDRATRGREHASDHAPAWIEIADTKSGPPRRGRRAVASAP